MTNLICTTLLLGHLLGPPPEGMVEPNHENLSAEQTLNLNHAVQEGYVPIYTYLEPDPDGAVPQGANPVPEPMTAILLTTGLVGIAVSKIRRKK